MRRVGYDNSGNPSESKDASIESKTGGFQFLADKKAGPLIGG